ncbi:Follistatin-related protein 5 [Hypsibius exemplaris]|uniref:Follistatin-related protein 5 n=1 Tax=Hypsibius exemplaris TaxID=2072580 RepID=A0A9X6RL17_HYPEX|nr:Follistatin-related protein 5 [Hypsibius exemplaris]
MWRTGIVVICIQGLIILQTVSSHDGNGRKSKSRKIRPDDHHNSELIHRRSYRQLEDRGYDKLLQEFGVPASTSTDSPLASNPSVDSPSFRTSDCSSLQCDHGRICRQSTITGNAECICRSHCPLHRNPVCGSNGNWYRNRCELHRISCLEGRALHIVEDSHKDHCSHAPLHSLMHEQETTMTPTTTTTTKTTQGSLATGDSQMSDNCTTRNYGIFKEQLLMRFTDRFQSRISGNNNQLDKSRMVQALLMDFDVDKNGGLDQRELVARQAEFDEASSQCDMDELLRNEDLNADEALDLNELLAAYGLTAAALEEPATTAAPATDNNNHHSWTVVAGNSIEIPCGIHQTRSSSSTITWERNHVRLNGLAGETGLAINDRTGALYVTHAQLIQAGNYSCFDEEAGGTSADSPRRQTHSLRVLLRPEVEVERRQHFERPYGNATLKCHAVGVPTPRVKWLKNEETLEHTSAKVTGEGNKLTLPNLLYKDTGVYSCVAENEAGSSSAISSVFVVDQKDRERPLRNLLVVFHAKGVTVYEPRHCRPKFYIGSNDKIPGGSELICGENNHGCSWGSVANVMDRYVYASQPLLNRVLVISLEQMMVVQVINTDNVPVKLSYVPHLDQIWILCWTSMDDLPSKTIQVVRDASEKTLHTAIHLEPVDGRFQTVTDLFVPPVQELAHQFAHAYAVCSSQKALCKIDMKSLRFRKTVDLAAYGCRPQKISYSSLAGLVFVDCNDLQRGTPKGQLILDYLTDAVLHHDQTINGVTHISPDSRYWVNLGTDVIRVQGITENGLVYLYDVVSGFHIADVTFHPSKSNHSHDLYATALTKDQLLHLELGTNRLSTISGIGFGTGHKTDAWGNADSRFLAYTGIFGSYVASAAKSSVFLSNTDTQTINCIIGEVPQPQHGLWVDRSFH